jgi:NADPH-ferrihemoprotein reductase
VMRRNLSKWFPFRATRSFVVPCQTLRPLGSFFASTAPVPSPASAANDLPTRPLSLKVLFGSQTGTAMGFAQKLVQLARKRNIKAQVIDLEDFNTDELNNSAPNDVYIFIQATFGQGEETDNAKKLFHWILDKNREVASERHKLDNLKFGVFGLGMSQTYPERYQAAAKRLDKRLVELGARKIIDRGEGDDNGDIENDFETWTTKLWDQLEAAKKTFSSASLGTSTPSTSSVQASGTQEISLNLEEEEILHSVTFYGVEAPSEGCNKIQKGVEYVPTTKMQPLKRTFDMNKVVDVRNPFEAAVSKIQELDTPMSGRSCKHIELDISSAPPSMKYQTGDYLGVYPENNEEIINAYLQRLHLRSDSVFEVKPSMHFPTPTSVYDYFKFYADLTGPLKRTHIAGLEPYATKSNERERLHTLSNSSEEFTKALADNEATLLDVLHQFPSIEIPLHHFIDVAPPLLPRYYSISSSNLLYPRTIHLTVGLNQHQTPAGRLHRGVCSSYLCNQTLVNSKIPIFVKNSLFKLPADSSRPILMIAAGTGLAPFRGFLQERIHLKESGKTVGQNILYFGCFGRKMDFLYGDELEAAVAKGNLQLVTAFSHEQPQMIFVQHRLKENAQQIWSLVHENKSFIYVCGANRMASAVESCLVEIAEKCGNMPRSDAQQYVSQLKASNTYQEDKFG